MQSVKTETLQDIKKAKGENRKEFTARLMEETERKYKEALRLYEETDLSVSRIARQENLNPKALRSYIGRRHRHLLLKRHGIKTEEEETPQVKLRKKGRGQKRVTHEKYKEAIAACQDEKYIQLNISAIASNFGLNPSHLFYQLRTHYPGVIEMREKERLRRGMADNHHRGARPQTLKKYAEAVDLLEKTQLTIEQAAAATAVSYSGLREHLLQYHGKLVEEREKKRINALTTKKEGQLNGYGGTRRPSQQKLEEFWEAVELYRTTSLTLKEIAEKTGVSTGALANHLKRWHRKLIFERRGLDLRTTDEYINLNTTKHYRKSAAEKYAAAIERLKNGADSVEGLAKELGFTPETFRDYLKEHEPELAARFGNIRLDNGKTVRARSAEKYKEAIEIYSNSRDSLRNIAQRLGLVYASLFGFIKRNHPEAIKKHQQLAGN